VTLVDRPGYDGSGYGCRFAGLSVLLDDEALLAVEDQCADDNGGSVPAISGTLAPSEPLSTFDGELGSGFWTLRISDWAEENTGNLVNWQLHLDCSSRDVDLQPEFFADRPRAMVAFTGGWGCLLGLILLWQPAVLGIGHPLFEASIENTMPLAIAAVVLAARIPLTAVSYATGAPGGLIVPALLFGVLAGQIFSQSYGLLSGGVDADFHAVCLVAGMAASIGALFRTPLTATIMAVEITGTYSCLLEISIAYIAAHSLLGLARQPDLYTALGRIHQRHVGSQPARLDAARPPG